MPFLKILLTFNASKCEFFGHPIRDVTSVRLSRVDFEAVLVRLHAYATQPAMLEHVAAMEQAELTRINPEPAMVDVEPETYPICLHSQQLLLLYSYSVTQREAHQHSR